MLTYWKDKNVREYLTTNLCFFLSLIFFPGSEFPSAKMNKSRRVPPGLFPLLHSSAAERTVCEWSHSHRSQSRSRRPPSFPSLLPLRLQGDRKELRG